MALIEIELTEKQFEDLVKKWLAENKLKLTEIIWSKEIHRNLRIVFEKEGINYAFLYPEIIVNVEKNSFGATFVGFLRKEGLLLPKATISFIEKYPKKTRPIVIRPL